GNPPGRHSASAPPARARRRREGEPESTSRQYSIGWAIHVFFKVLSDARDDPEADEVVVLRLVYRERLAAEVAIRRSRVRPAGSLSPKSDDASGRRTAQEPTFQQFTGSASVNQPGSRRHPPSSKRHAMRQRDCRSWRKTRGGRASREQVTRRTADTAGTFSTW